MPTEKTIRIGALNIKTTPHSPELYVALIDSAYRARTAANYRGNNFASIGNFSILSNTEDDPVYCGQINCYTDFDLDKPWLDKNTGKAADENELKSIQLPSSLRPEFKAIEFVFFPRRHRLFFRIYLSHNSTKNIVYTILKQHQRKLGIERLDVLIEQEQEQLDSIFSLRELRKLEITISKPNPDDTGKYDKIIKQRLEKQRAAKLTTVLEAEHGQTLEPDPETRTMAALALSDGVVRAHGIDETGRVTNRSTESHPLAINAVYNPNTQDTFETIREKAVKELEKIKTRIRVPK